jgi:hypothetical protein
VLIGSGLREINFQESEDLESMKKFLTVLAVSSFGTAYAFATACSTSPTPNPPIPNNLIGGLTSGLTTPTSNPATDNPCTVGNLTFSNFTYDIDAGSFTTTPPQVNLENASATSGLVQFGFDPNLAASSDLEFEFQVMSGVTGVQLSATGLQGTGFVDETVCTVFIGPNQSCGNGPGGNGGTELAILDITANGNVVSDAANGFSGVSTSAVGGGVATATFASQGEIWIYKDINSGNSPYSEVNQGFIVPEPVTTSLVGLGLLGIGLLGRRLRK